MLPASDETILPPFDSRARRLGGAEKRAAPRLAVRELSEIILAGGKQAIACMVRDRSGCGAGLEVTCGDLPKRFLLANHGRREKIVCRQVWRHGGFMGVSFLSEPRRFNLD